MGLFPLFRHGNSKNEVVSWIFKGKNEGGLSEPLIRVIEMIKDEKRGIFYQ